VAAHPDKADWFISFGYQPALHGRYGRAELDALFPDRPVVLIQRSFHETYLNTAATDKLGLTAEIVGGHPQVDWPDGHFFETGNKLVMARLMPYFLRPEWYHRGLQMTAQLMHQGGITTAGDMLFGGINPDYELTRWTRCCTGAARRCAWSTCSTGAASPTAQRCQHRPAGPADRLRAGPGRDAAAVRPRRPQGVVQQGRQAVRRRRDVLAADADERARLHRRPPRRVADGARGAGRTACAPSGTPAGRCTCTSTATAAWTRCCRRWKRRRPRSRASTTASSCTTWASTRRRRRRASRRWARMPASTRTTSTRWPTTTRASASGPSARRRSRAAARCCAPGMKVSFHSDFMMAPTEPLLLAWCAATRTTASGRVVSPDERLTLMQALRGVTIDAAWALRVEHEVGSIAAGKRADFCVLMDDPFELGVDRLKDVRIAGTVFEGTPHLLAQPVASLHAALPAWPSHRRASPRAVAGPALPAAAARCCGAAATSATSAANGPPGPRPALPRESVHLEK
jgi:hypothetical protein